VLTDPLPQRQRRPPLSPRQEYEEFVLQRIEDYKNQLSREDLLTLADESVQELEAGPDGQRCGQARVRVPACSAPGPVARSAGMREDIPRKEGPDMRISPAKLVAAALALAVPASGGGAT